MGPRYRFALIASLAVGCGSGPELGPVLPAAPPIPVGQVIGVDVTVRFLSIERGCWVLESSAGRYEPVDLPPALRVEGRTAHLRLTGVDDMASICMAGPLVRIDTTARR